MSIIVAKLPLDAEASNAVGKIVRMVTEEKITLIFSFKNEMKSFGFEWRVLPKPFSFSRSYDVEGLQTVISIFSFEHTGKELLKISRTKKGLELSWVTRNSTEGAMFIEQQMDAAFYEMLSFAVSK